RRGHRLRPVISPLPRGRWREERWRRHPVHSRHVRTFAPTRCGAACTGAVHAAAGTKITSVKTLTFTFLRRPGAPLLARVTANFFPRRLTCGGQENCPRERAPEP